MSVSDDDKTRIIGKRTANPVVPPPPPVVVDGKIVFHCPKGHRLVVAAVHAGKRGRCDRAGCGAALVVPSIPGPDESPVADAIEVPEAEIEQAAEPASKIAEPAADDGAAAAGAEAGGEAWNFDLAGGQSTPAPAPAPVSPAPAAAAGTWDRLVPDGGGIDAGPSPGTEHPTARLTARLWAEREHGGIVEIHLAGGSVLVPEWYEARWSRGTHGLFASPGANETVTLTAVAWDTVQKIVVRQLPAVPDGMFE